MVTEAQESELDVLQDSDASSTDTEPVSRGRVASNGLVGMKTNTDENLASLGGRDGAGAI